MTILKVTFIFFCVPLRYSCCAKVRKGIAKKRKELFCFNNINKINTESGSYIKF